MSIWVQLLLVLLLILLNGFFAMAELALMLARKVRLEIMAQNGQRGARLALTLAAQPSRFLSTVQVGITLVGIFTGAISGATLAEEVSHWLAARLPILGAWTAPLALTLDLTSVGYLSLVAGELVPKQLAVSSPEAIAAFVAGPMQILSAIATPMIWLLEVSSRLLLRILGRHESPPQVVTEEEVRALIAEGARAGVLKPAEKEMMAGVMRLADWRVRAFMTPRPNIHWINIEDDALTLRSQLRTSAYSRLPVARDDLDELLGIVQAKDLLDQILDDQPLDIRGALRDAVVVHGNSPALSILEILKNSPLHLALVVDEYGSIQGIITATDILQAIVGSLANPAAEPSPGVTKRQDGSWLVDGDLAFDMASDLMGIKSISARNGEYTTVAGFVLTHLGHIPVAGEHFNHGDYYFEVVDMDGRRIDKLLVAYQGQQKPALTETYRS